MENRKLHIISISSIACLNILFVIYYVVLCFNAGLHYDDYHQMWRLADASVLDNTIRVYFNASGRFMFYIVNAIMYKLINLGVSYHVFPLIYWISGILLTYFAVCKILSSFPKVEVFLYVSLFYNLYILTVIDFAVFFWLAAIWYYFLPPMALFLIFVINKRDCNWIYWILLIILSVALGGGQEAFTPVVLVALFVNAVLIVRQYDWNICKAYSEDKRCIRLIVASCIILLCFIIVVIAPGNYQRMNNSISEGFHSPATILEWCVGIVSALGTFAYFQSFYLVYYIVLFAISALIGYKRRDSFRLSISRNQIICSLLLFLAYLIVSVIPIVFVYCGFGIQRLYIHIVFFTMAFICYIGYIIGVKCNVKLNIIYYSQIASTLFLIFIMSINIHNDVPIAQKYHESFVERTRCLEHVSQLKETPDVLYLKPMYVATVVDSKFFILSILNRPCDKSLLYYQSDINNDSYVMHIKKYYQFPLSLKLSFE